MSSRKKQSRRRPAKASPSGTVGADRAGQSRGRSRRWVGKWRVTLLAVALLALVAVGVPPVVSRHWFDRGVTEMKSHRFERADEHFARAERWSRRGGLVAFCRGRVAWMKGDLPASRSYLEEASGLGFNAKRVEREEQLIEIRGGSAAANRSRLSAMLQTYPEDGPITLEAFTLGFLARGDADGATQMLAIWRDADANDPRVHYWLGVVEQTRSRPTAAIAHFHAALEIAPQMDRARLALAGILKSRLFFAEALAQYRLISDAIADAAEVEVGLGICLLKTGSIDEGVRRLEAVLAAAPDNLPASLALAEHFLETDQPRRALDVAQPQVDDNPSDITLNYVLSAAHRQLDHPVRSAEHFEAYRRSNRQFEMTQMLKREYQDRPRAGLAGQIASGLMQSQWQEAGTWILTALAEDPSRIELHSMMAEYLRRSGHPDRARVFQENAETLSQRAGAALP